MLRSLRRESRERRERAGGRHLEEVDNKVGVRVTVAAGQRSQGRGQREEIKQREQTRNRERERAETPERADRKP